MIDIDALDADQFLITDRDAHRLFQFPWIAVLVKNRDVIGNDFPSGGCRRAGLLGRRSFASTHGLRLHGRLCVYGNFFNNDRTVYRKKALDADSAASLGGIRCLSNGFRFRCRLHCRDLLGSPRRFCRRFLLRFLFRDLGRLRRGYLFRCIRHFRGSCSWNCLCRFLLCGLFRNLLCGFFRNAGLGISFLGMSLVFHCDRNG